MTLGNNGNQTRKRLADPVREHSCNGIFGREMTGIYQRQAERLCTLHQVIRAVADYKGISALRERAVHQLGHTRRRRPLRAGLVCRSRRSVRRLHAGIP